MASVATRILQGSSGSLNFLACDSFVPVNSKTKPGLLSVTPVFIPDQLLT